MTGPVDAFSPGAFPTSGLGQERFVQRLLHRRYAGLETVHRPWVPFLASGFLWLVAGTGVSFRDGMGRGTLICITLATVQLILALSSRQRFAKIADQAQMGRKDARLELADDEKVLLRLNLEKRASAKVRILSFLLQTVWGLSLFIMAAGMALSPHPDAIPTWGVAGLGLVAYFGAHIFGLGIRALFGVEPAAELVLTSQRIVALGKMGGIAQVPLTALKNRPVVVGRSEGKATLGLALRPAKSAGRLPFMALWGADAITDADARLWAEKATAARRAMLGVEGEMAS
jgi:hypothetical protein